MEELLMDVNWIAVVVGAIAAYALGALCIHQNFLAKVDGGCWSHS